MECRSSLFPAREHLSKQPGLFTNRHLHGGEARSVVKIHPTGGIKMGLFYR